MNTPIYAGRRIVGEVRGEVFYKTISRSQHFLRIPPAIAFDVSTLEDAKRCGAKYVEIFETDEHKKWRASIDEIFGKGQKLNRGHGDQIFLTLSFWEIDGKPPAQAKSQAQAAKAPSAVQGKLF